MPITLSAPWYALIQPRTILAAISLLKGSEWVTADRYDLRVTQKLAARRCRAATKLLTLPNQRYISNQLAHYMCLKHGNAKAACYAMLCSAPRHESET